VAQDGETGPFYLQDDTGNILVRPEGAKIEPTVLFDETCDRGHPLYYSKGPPQSVADSDHRRRFVESAIALHAPLFLVGQARERADVVAPEIAVPVFGKVPPTVNHTVSAPTPNELPGLMVPESVTVD